jgi:hypothetical protein
MSADKASTSPGRPLGLRPAQLPGRLQRAVGSPVTCGMGPIGGHVVDVAISVCAAGSHISPCGVAADLRNHSQVKASPRWCPRQETQNIPPTKRRAETRPIDGRAPIESGAIGSTPVSTPPEECGGSSRWGDSDASPTDHRYDPDPLLEWSSTAAQRRHGPDATTSTVHPPRAPGVSISPRRGRNTDLPRANSPRRRVPLHRS